MSTVLINCVIIYNVGMLYLFGETIAFLIFMFFIIPLIVGVIMLIGEKRKLKNVTGSAGRNKKLSSSIAILLIILLPLTILALFTWNEGTKIQRKLSSEVGLIKLNNEYTVTSTYCRDVELKYMCTVSYKTNNSTEVNDVYVKKILEQNGYEVTKERNVFVEDNTYKAVNIDKNIVITYNQEYIDTSIYSSASPTEIIFHFEAL